MQIPPMFAALKYGEKLYEYAQGKKLLNTNRAIKIYYIKNLRISASTRLYFEVKCLKYYIRTLCAQIGDALGCGGHMAFLLRKEVSPLPCQSRML